jgi:hypothetical protein
MIQDIQQLLDQYIAWLKDKTALRKVGDWVKITTPYLDRHNDYVQIYAKKANSGFVLTDDGYTIGDLEQSGCQLDSPKRQDLLKMTLNGFGVQLHDRAIAPGSVVPARECARGIGRVRASGLRVGLFKRKARRMGVERKNSLLINGLLSLLSQTLSKKNG